MSLYNSLTKYRNCTWYPQQSLVYQEKIYFSTHRFRSPVFQKEDNSYCLWSGKQLTHDQFYFEYISQYGVTDITLGSVILALR